MNEMLRIENLKKKYPSFSLKGVSFDIKPGQIMGFIGRNGAGKTTTLKCVMNLVHYDSGSVYLYGVLKGWGGPKGQFGDLNLTWGDKLTIIAYKTTYKGLVEGVGVYLSSEKQ